jgi:protein-L-isoaspartate(D-aspartate) O-methyltransferase
MKPLTLIALVALGIVLAAPASADAESDFKRAREAMVVEVAAMAKLTRASVDGRRLDGKVMGVLGEVPRHEFVPESRRRSAYENRPLPIGYGQTISQPYIVALMTDLAEVDGHAKVLEIGTGSGYQAAVLGALVDKVYTMEIVPPLAASATKRLKDLGYDNVTVRHGDGYYGWPEHAPFDAIVVTAAASHIPPPLVRQLKRGGRMVIPVGSAFAVQQLVLVQRDANDEVRISQILPVRFVPLTGDH